MGKHIFCISGCLDNSLQAEVLEVIKNILAQAFLSVRNVQHFVHGKRMHLRTFAAIYSQFITCLRLAKGFEGKLMK